MYAKLVLATTAAAWAATAVQAQQMTPPAGQPPASAPSAAVGKATTQPASCPAWSGEGVDRIELPGRTPPGICWICRPAAYALGRQLPVVVCLHGTDDTAEQMIAFWRQRRTRFPAIFLAPQGVGQGWCSDDVQTIKATFEFLSRCVWHDPDRVLLAGFSAGGVMTMQALYHDRLPVTAAAALANYVPPLLTAEEINARRSVPVFYAVGMEDINRERMRSGLEFLRAAGANVELHHPRLGHTLDANVAQAALDWFFDQCEKQTEATISAAAVNAGGSASRRLETIVAQAGLHPPEQVRRADEVLVRIEQPGREKLLAAQRLLEENKAGPAVTLLREVENSYGLGRLGIEARRRRDQVEADPTLGPEVRQFESEVRAEQGMAEYVRAQRLVAQQRLTEAEELCRQILITYADTPAAMRAQTLLGMLEGRTRR